MVQNNLKMVQNNQKIVETAKWGARASRAPLFGGFKLMYDCFVPFLDCFEPFLIVFSDFSKFLMKLVLRLLYCNLGLGPFSGAGPSWYLERGKSLLADTPVYVISVGGPRGPPIDWGGPGASKYTKNINF